MQIFNPVILEKVDAKNQLNNGDMAFSVEDKKIYFKNNNNLDAYGGVTESEVNSIINQNIESKQLDMNWIILD